MLFEIVLTPDDRLVRDMWFEAGWAVKVPFQTLERFPDPDRQAIDLVSNNLNEMFHLEIDHASLLGLGRQPIRLWGEAGGGV